MSNLIFAYFPLLLLIFLMAKKNGMASSRALPLCAFIAYLVVIFVFHFDITLVHASVISGLLLALTPLSIVAGAIFLFKCMEDTGALGVLRSGLNSVSAHPIAQLMIVGWSFTFLIEGASGFGTPAAIAAPILFALGFPAIKVAMFCLILNTIPVTFGALGTPIWFGLSPVSLDQPTMMAVAFEAALINTLVAPILVFVALRIVIDDWRTIRQSALFVLLSALSCALPHLLLSRFDVEFPSLIGGSIGLVITLFLAKKGIGLSRLTDSKRQSGSTTVPPLRRLAAAAFPLYGTVILLLLTRLPDVGLKTWLQATSPSLHISLGALGDLAISQSLVFSLTNILNTSVNWKHSVLYVPSIIPFVVIGLLTVLIYRNNGRSTSTTAIATHTLNKLKAPFFALLGALVFVNLMMLGDEQAAVALIGGSLASVTGQYWTFFAPLLGALGSFFSGSATISNLTFSGVQMAIAQQLSLPAPTILALQSVGAAMGNMVCINNIVAVTAILGLKQQDGEILRRNVVALSVYALIAGTLGVLLV